MGKKGMGKKGTVIHWIFIFGVFFGIGFYTISQLSSASLVQTKGAWQLSFIRATQSAQADLLQHDALAYAAIVGANEGVLSSLKTDCGEFNGVALWNSKKTFCEVNVDADLEWELGTALEGATGVSFREFDFSDGVSAKAEREKLISNSWEHVPVEKRWYGLDEPYDAYLIRPFYLQYAYNPGVHFAVETPASFVAGVVDQVKVLVDTCAGSADLKGCLDSAKGDLKYYDCDSEQFTPGDMQVFCYENGQRVRFALDFSLEDVRFNLDKTNHGGRYVVTFDYDASVDSYNLHYTDSPTAQGRSGPVASVFAGVIPPRVQAVFEIVPVEECPDSKEMNVGYVCAGSVWYEFEDSRDLYVGVTSVVDGEESEIEVVR